MNRPASSPALSTTSSPRRNRPSSQSSARQSTPSTQIPRIRAQTPSDDLVDAYVRFLEESPDLSRVYIRIGVSGAGSNPELSGRMVRHHEARVARFAAAMKRQSPELSETLADRRAETLVLALNGIALHRIIDPEFDVAWHARALLEDAAAVS